MNELSEDASELLRIAESSFDERRHGVAESWSGASLDRIHDLLNADFNSGLWASYFVPTSALARLLGEALECEDSSSIRWWLIIAVARLGCVGVLDILESKVTQRTDGVDNTFYWLPQILSEDALAASAARLNSMWIKVKSLRPVGRLPGPFGR